MPTWNSWSRCRWLRSVSTNTTTPPGVATQPEEALADLNRAIQLDSQSARVFSNRGEIYRIMQRYNKALDDFNHAINLDPQSARSLSNRGEINWQMQRYDAALADFNRALELLPNNDWLLHHRALVYQALDQTGKQL